jgi:hypothetical protein
MMDPIPAKYKQCPLCHQSLWVTENGIAAHVWHGHPESRICMAHGKSSQKHGDPTAPSCHGGTVMALCALRIARGRVVPTPELTYTEGLAAA